MVFLVIGFYISFGFLTFITFEYNNTTTKAQNIVLHNEIPEYFSWKDYNGKDWTTPAKDQYQYSLCADCCIFSGIGIIESVIKIREGYADFNPDLSEQYVLSCLPKAGGCKGTCDVYMYEYIIDEGPDGNDCNGIVLESCFPYVGRDV